MPKESKESKEPIGHNIRVNKVDVKGSIIVNSFLTDALVNTLCISDYEFSKIQVSKIPIKRFEILKMYSHTVTIDTGNVTGVLIFTILNGAKTLFYYNYSVFTILYKDLDIYDEKIFNDHIFSVQKIQSIPGEKECVYFLIYASLTGYSLDSVSYSSDIFIKPYCQYKHIRSIIDDYIPVLPFKVQGLLFVPSQTDKYKCLSFPLI